MRGVTQSALNEVGCCRVSYMGSAPEARPRVPYMSGLCNTRWQFPYYERSIFNKGGLIPFQYRLIGGGLIFLLGSQLIYYGMRFNGSYRFGGPAWSLVSSVHSLIVYSLLAALIGAAMLSVIVLVLAWIPDGKDKATEPEEHTPLPPVLQTTKEIEKQKREYEATRREAERVRKAQEKKRIEIEQLLEEQRKIEAIKARRERSAEDVARSGLDDFL